MKHGLLAVLFGARELSYTCVGATVGIGLFSTKLDWLTRLVGDEIGAVLESME